MEKWWWIFLIPQPDTCRPYLLTQLSLIFFTMTFFVVEQVLRYLCLSTSNQPNWIKIQTHWYRIIWVKIYIFIIIIFKGRRNVNIIIRRHGMYHGHTHNHHIWSYINIRNLRYKRILYRSGIHVGPPSSNRTKNTVCWRPSVHNRKTII